MIPGEQPYFVHSLRHPWKRRVTIAGGVISAPSSWIEIETQAGAASDDLDTITGGRSGERVVIMAADDSHTVVVKHGTGNILTPDSADISLSTDDIALEILFDGTHWHVLGGASGQDANAIHDNVAGEITAVTEKTSPVANDEIVAEDSEDSNNKKSIKLGNLYLAGMAGIELSTRTIYADADSGDDDTGDGSSGSPYETYAKALSAVRGIINDGVTITIHLNAATATYTPADTGRVCIGTGKLVIEGELTSLESATSDSGDATSMTDTGAFSGDSYAKKLLYVADQYRIVHAHDNDTLNVVARFATSPGTDTYTVYDWGSAFNDILNVVQGNVDTQYISGPGVHINGPVVTSIEYCALTATSINAPVTINFDGSVVAVETCLLDAASAAYRAFYTNDQAFGHFKIRRSYLCGGTWYALEVGGPGCFVFLYYGNRLDQLSAASTSGIMITKNALITMYCPTVNGAADKNNIVNCATYGLRVTTGAQGSATSTAFNTYTNCGTDRSNESASFGYYS